MDINRMRELAGMPVTEKEEIYPEIENAEEFVSEIMSDNEGTMKIRNLGANGETTAFASVSGSPEEIESEPADMYSPGEAGGTNLNLRFIDIEDMDGPDDIEDIIAQVEEYIDSGEADRDLVDVVDDYQRSRRDY